VAIQNALTSCAANTVVLLNPGTYTLHRSSIVCYGYADDYATGEHEGGLCIPASKVLRGSGANNTILNYGDGASIINMGQTYLSSSSVVFIPITAGSTQGSTSITLQSASGITVGSYLVITQTNPPDTDGNPLVNTTGYTGSCSGCGHDLTNNVMSQIDRVTAVSGNVVTLERPLYFNYNTSPQAYRLPMIENAGLENLRVVGTAASGTALEFKNVNLEACAHCWVHNVESDWAVDKSSIYFSDVYGSEISNNYAYQTFNHNSGAGYMILCEFRCSENLIQNNIIVLGRHTFPMNGGSGNVYAYNYILNDYMGEYPNSLPETQGHGAHPYMNLFEGNVFSSLEFDFAHGSSSHNTVFRNYINYTNLNPSTGTNMTGALFGINVAYYNNYENFLGNVIGQISGNCSPTNYEINANASQGPTVYKLGYYDDGGTASPNSALSAKVGQTILRGGNWDCKTNSVVWSSNVPSGSLVSTYLNAQTLPNSLYLSGTPPWFAGTGAVWPPIDPSTSTKANKIPAQLCYESGPMSGAAFNPSSCYGSAVSPQPPVNLTAIVH